MNMFEMPTVMRISDSRRGFRLDIGFMDHSNPQLVTTPTRSAIADLHTLQITVTHTSVLSVTRRILVTVLTMAISLPPGSSPLWTVAPFQLSAFLTPD
jgi:hypothetical protein